MALENVVRATAAKPPAEQLAAVRKTADYAYGKLADGNLQTAREAFDFCARLVTGLRQAGTAPELWGRAAGGV